ncbi:MAG: sulfoxide reductase heme-binding subunit YedZ [Nitrospiraceae bacterium]|nr:sulfoxide reductase heme-binding subunit YedZ [Nitrospiraceae bacterium]
MLSKIKPFVFFLSLLPFAWLVFNFFISGLGANPIEKIIHITGDWTLNFLVITLLISPLREITGLPWLPNLRKMLGLFSFFYACLHFLAYAGLDQLFSFDSIFFDIQKHKRIIVGFITFLFLAFLAITSNDRIKQKLGMRWKIFHKLIYLAAIGGIIHYLLLVKRDIRIPLIYAGIFTILFVYRIIKQLMKKYNYSQFL